MSTLSPEQADTVLEVNRANAIKRAVSKVKARKPLTRAEMGLLQSIAYSPGQKGLFLITVAKTVVEPAAAPGCSRRSISNWRKLEGAPEPNANGTHDVIAWRRFMHEKRPDGSEPGDEEGLKIRKLPAEIHESGVSAGHPQGRVHPQGTGEGSVAGPVRARGEPAALDV